MWINLEGIMLKNMSFTTSSLLFHLYEVTKIVEFIETATAFLLGSGGGEMGSGSSLSTEFQFHKMKSL